MSKGTFRTKSGLPDPKVKKKETTEFGVVTRPCTVIEICLALHIYRRRQSLEPCTGMDCEVGGKWLLLLCAAEICGSIYLKSK